jgi:uncharacterized protein (UPF0335 family)
MEITALPNSIAARAKPFLQRVENLEADKESRKGSYKQECAAINEDIKIVYTEAKHKGVSVKALKRVVKQRKLESKIKALAADLDIDDAAQFDALADAFGDTPFGRHAAARAEELHAQIGRNGHANATADPVDALAY